MLTTFNQPIFFESLRLKGEQVADFLHNQTTMNFKSFQIHQVACAAFCNRQGRIITNAIIMQESSSIWLLIFRQSMAQKWLAAQKVWLKMARIEVVDQTQPDHSHHWQIEALTRSNTVPAIIEAKYQNNQIILQAESATLSIQVNTSQSMQVQNLHTAQMYQYFPAWISEDTTLQFTPAQLRYPEFGLIDFEKGCYLGQEIIARMHYKGKVKQYAVYRDYKLISDAKWENDSVEYRLDLPNGCFKNAYNQAATQPVTIIDAILLESNLHTIVLQPNSS